MTGKWQERLAERENLCGRPTLTGSPCGQSRRYNWGFDDRLIKPSELPACRKHATPAERASVEALLTERQAESWRFWRPILGRQS